MRTLIGVSLLGLAGLGVAGLLVAGAAVEVAHAIEAAGEALPEDDALLTPQWDEWETYWTEREAA